MMNLSIVLVNYNSKNYLRKCLSSIYSSPLKISFEVILVDNASSDGSLELVEENFPKVKIIKNSKNVGFPKGNNQGLINSKGKYLLSLNTDTIILVNALDTLVDFMESNPEVGACGPKILNADGTLQPQCKRGFPTPLAGISYFLGLHRLFPSNKTFGKYLMTYLDPNQINEVDALSGSCMMVRREVIEQVGLMDEDYFMYGDDLDWCFRIKQAGWKIYYVPDAQIIHFGGQGGTQSRPYSAIYHFNKSAYIFYKKHLAHNYPFFINWLVYSGIILKFLLSILLNFPRKNKYAGSGRPSMR